MQTSHLNCYVFVLSKLLILDYIFDFGNKGIHAMKCCVSNPFFKNPFWPLMLAFFILQNKTLHIFFKVIVCFALYFFYSLPLNTSNYPSQIIKISETLKNLHLCSTAADQSGKAYWLSDGALLLEAGGRKHSKSFPETCSLFCPKPLYCIIFFLIEFLLSTVFSNFF